MSKHAIAGSGRGVVAGNDDQFAATEVCEGDLDGALGKAGRVGKHAYARDDRFPFLPRGLPVKIQINQKSGRLLIVPDNVPH